MRRARDPDDEGFVERDGVRVFYEAFGAGEPTLLLLPTWEIVHSRTWKCQIPYLSRHCRVATFDRRGNGRSDRPLDVAASDRRAHVGDALAVLDRVGAERAIVVSWCGGGDDLILTAEHPERVDGLVLLAPDLELSTDPAAEEGWTWEGEPESEEGWKKWNRSYMLRDWRGFVEFFFGECFTEPHSTKPMEDAVAWGLETDGATIVRGLEAEWPNDRESALQLCAEIRCPTLVLQGSEDAVVGPARGPAVAAAIPGSQLITLEAAATPRTCATRCGPTWCCATSPSRPRRPRAGCGGGRESGARSTCRRRSGSGTRGATPRSPTSCARSIPTSRSTGWRSTR